MKTTIEKKQDEISKIEISQQNLKSDFKGINALVEERLQEINVLNDSLSYKNSEILEAESNLRNTENEATNLNATLKNLYVELSSLKNENAEYKKMLASKNEQLGELQNILEKKELSIKKISSSFEDSFTKNVSLVQETFDLEEKVLEIKSGVTASSHKSIYHHKDESPIKIDQYETLKNSHSVAQELYNQLAKNTTKVLNYSQELLSGLIKSLDTSVIDFYKTCDIFTEEGNKNIDTFVTNLFESYTKKVEKYKESDKNEQRYKPDTENKKDWDTIFDLYINQFTDKCETSKIEFENFL